MDIFALPHEILIHCIAPFLSKTERYRVFSSCKAYKPLLLEVRTIWMSQVRWNKFVDCECYRSKLLKIVGLDNRNSHSCTRKLNILLTCNIEAREVDHAISKQYRTFLMRNYAYTISDSAHNNDPFSCMTSRYTHLKNEFWTQRTIHLPFQDLYKLHRLIVNEYNEIVNMEDLLLDFDPTRDDKKKSLAKLKNILSVELHRNNECNLQLCYGYSLKILTLHYVENENIDASLLEGVELLQLFEGMNTIAASSLNLEGTRYFQIYKYPNIDIGLFRNLERVLLSCLDYITDIGMLGGVKFLNVVRCNGIRRWPKPSGRDQSWRFCNNIYVTKDLRGYEILKTLALTFCDSIEDISMLGKITQLDVGGCTNISKYPKPLGSNQRWELSSSSMVDLTGYDKLLSLQLFNCENLTDLRILGNLKELHVCKCLNIISYPLPTRNDQEWCFQECNISDLTGYNRLYSLTLTNCQEVRDVSPLHDIHTLHINNCNNITNVRTLTKVKLLYVKSAVNYIINDVKTLTNVEELHFVN